MINFTRLYPFNFSFAHGESLGTRLALAGKIWKQPGVIKPFANLQVAQLRDELCNLHVIVMRRHNQTRYTAYSVAAMFSRRRLPLSETQAVTRQVLCYNHRQFHCHCTCSWNKQQSRSRWTDLPTWVFCKPRDFQLNRQKSLEIVPKTGGYTFFRRVIHS